MWQIAVSLDNTHEMLNAAICHEIVGWFLLLASPFLINTTPIGSSPKVKSSQLLST